MEIIKVKFVNSFHQEPGSEKLYSYRTFLKDLSVGDLVAVETANGYTVAEVVRFVTSSAYGTLSYAFQKIDVNGLNNEKARQKEIEEVRFRIDLQVQKTSEKARWKELAKADPELKALIETLESLGE
ncbi:hypothetical protein V8K88_000057 [Listeria monocytogenes]|uniref:hypothetical protein n=1 Tax=Listeria monocytogenes TaxID=1639 RepID=UPI00086D3D03|nr:hypothetical protein [Listeria monocytogenes]EAD4381145.1 hypothetical protein [Listeria monocytogenes]EAD4384209.1 hypothetical protein [Listeria monocytogenes]EAD4387263.1 hypothetical protein [Listeria monocytogenes]EAE4828456.1 hypothetical protein [Listeria monocytogenes]EAE4958904.1 hypothetical protein [Listeria monocytogenes]